ncbi:hypothetical protein AHMF7616_04754 [Adhaeribacter pallidiroseus]|uniref:Gluconolactonase n=1 Tax=Adhaeribacter pallidiroseus TaxID=2072847 RepID=A0A369QMG4_9BACT|nr:hypothetical protein AHMF7616_04754 [Adhaeribacter pallidiroseus]
MYRIQTEYLRNPDLSEQELKMHVQDLGRFTTTDGMIFDLDGNLYLGDYQNYAIVQITPDLEMKTIMKDDRLIWPDSYSLSTDGHLYISCSQINKQPDYNEGKNQRTLPYTIYRMPLP